MRFSIKQSISFQELNDHPAYPVVPVPLPSSPGPGVVADHGAAPRCTASARAATAHGQCGRLLPCCAPGCALYIACYIKPRTQDLCSVRDAWIINCCRRGAESGARRRRNFRFLLSHASLHITCCVIM